MRHYEFPEYCSTRFASTLVVLVALVMCGSSQLQGVCQTVQQKQGRPHAACQSLRSCKCIERFRASPPALLAGCQRHAPPPVQLLCAPLCACTPTWTPDKSYDLACIRCTSNLDTEQQPQLVGSQILLQLLPESLWLRTWQGGYETSQQLMSIARARQVCKEVAWTNECQLLATGASFT